VPKPREPHRRPSHRRQPSTAGLWRLRMLAGVILLLAPVVAVGAGRQGLLLLTGAAGGGEAYLRLVDTETVQHWNSRGHFFMAAAESMRRILMPLQ